MKNIFSLSSLCNKCIISILYIIANFAFMPADTFAQDCGTINCTSNDVQITRAYLRSNLAGDPLDPTCISGSNVQAYLFLELSTNTPRIGVSISGKIRLKLNNEILKTVGQCFSDTLEGNGTIVKFTSPVSWPCGASIALSDVLISWGTGNTNFCTGSDPQCPATKSKCWRQPPSEYITIETFPCTSPTINAQPINQLLCAGSASSFTFSYSNGTPAPSIQWQVSVDNGTTWMDLTNSAPYSGVMTTTLSISSTTIAMNGNRYKAVLTNNTQDHQCGASTNGLATLNIYAYPTAPNVGVINNCDGTSTLTANNYTGTLMWSTGESTPTISVNLPGNYTVTQTLYQDIVTPYGCTSTNGSGYADPKTNPTAPAVSVVNNCDGTSLLTASNYTGELLWNTGETSKAITVNSKGTYTVTQTLYKDVVAANGCTSAIGSGYADPQTSPAAPIVIVSNNCDGTSVLVASDYTGELLWNTGETSNAITVNTMGTYTVTQTLYKDIVGANGCTSANGSGYADPKTTPIAPTVSVVNNCDGTSVLTASNFTGELLWNTGETSPTIIVNNMGICTVTQTLYKDIVAPNGCTSSNGSGYADPKNTPIAPIVTVSNNCDGTSVLAASNYTGDLLWSTGETSNVITVNSMGTYTVTQTLYKDIVTPNGCTSANGSGYADPQRPPAAPMVTVTNNCDGTSVLAASNFTGDLLWSTGETSNAITVSSMGTYTVTQTLYRVIVTPNGCTSANGSGFANPQAPPSAPVVTVVNNCDGTSVLTAANYAGELLWSTGETTPVITVNSMGTYTVTQTLYKDVTPNGCTSANGSGYANPKTTPVAPTVAVVDNCNGTSTITASNYTGDLLWSTGETTNVITVNTIGNYTVSQTLYKDVIPNGCTSTNGSGYANPGNTPAAAMVTYNPPACDEVTFSVTVTSVGNGVTYTIKDKNGNNIPGVLPANNVVAAGTDNIIFSNIPAGSGYKVTASLGFCSTTNAECGVAPGGQRVVSKSAKEVNITLFDKGPTVLAYPNPFQTTVNFKLASPVSGRASLDVYDASGQRIGNAFNGVLQANVPVNTEFRLSKPASGILFYRLLINGTSVSGKIMSIK